jgi:hypothetical protein
VKRTDFIAAASVVGATSIATRAQAQAPIPGGTAFVETQADFDYAAFEKLLGRSADIRQVFENIAVKPSGLNNIKNALNGLEFGYGYSRDRIAVAAANHGPSSSYTFADAIWAKYRIGEYFNLTDPKSGAFLTQNVYYPRKFPETTSTDPNDVTGTFQDTGIAALQARGVVFLTCHTAVEEQARGLVAAGHAPAGASASDVANDILTHLIPGAVVVPGMVATLAVLQHRWNYTFATIQS